MGGVAAYWGPPSWTKAMCVWRRARLRNLRGQWGQGFEGMLMRIGGGREGNQRDRAAERRKGENNAGECLRLRSVGSGCWQTENGYRGEEKGINCMEVVWKS